MTAVSILKSNARSFLEKSQARSKSQIEVMLENIEQRSVSWAGGRPSLQSISIEDGTCIRVLEEGGQGIITAKGMASPKAAELVSKALDMARLSPKDVHRTFAKPAKNYPAAIESDSEAFKITTDEIQKHFSDMEKKVLASDSRLKKIIKMNYSETLTRFALANSHGVSLASENSSFGFVVEILAEQNGETEVGWDYQMHRYKKNLDVEGIVTSVAVETLQSLGGKPIASGAYPVVVHPRVGTQFLSLITEALSAESVQLGRSFWRNGTGSSVASSSVNLIDDPLLKGGVASSPFDDEGVPHEKINVVEGGVLRDYFYDLRSAHRNNRSSNGRGIKSSLGALPKPGPTNFFMQPGTPFQESLLSAEKKVFLLKDVMGLHMADSITGEFSLGASGALYENGRFVKPVRGVTVSGTVGELFKRIIAVADNLSWYGSLGTPSFLVDHLTVAGA